jgi:hypothetical protein
MMTTSLTTMMTAVLTFTTHPHTSWRTTLIARRAKRSTVLLRTTKPSTRVVTTELLTTAAHAHTTTVHPHATTEVALRLTIALLTKALLLLLLRRRPVQRSMDMNKKSETIEICIHILLLLCMLLISMMQHLFLDLVNETHCIF